MLDYKMSFCNFDFEYNFHYVFYDYDTIYDSAPPSDSKGEKKTLI